MKLSEYAKSTIEEVQAVFQEFRTMNPGMPDEALATLTDTAVRVINENAEEVFG